MKIALVLAAVCVALAGWALFERDGRIEAQQKVDRLRAQAEETAAALKEWTDRAEEAAAEAAKRAAEADALRARIRRASPSEGARIGADALRGRP